MKNAFCFFLLLLLLLLLLLFFKRGVRKKVEELMIPRKKKIRLSLPPHPAPPPFKDFLLVAKSTFLSRTPPSSFQRCQLARSTAGRYTQSGIFQILCLTCRNCHAKCCGTLTEVIQMWHFFRGSLFGICCWLRAGWQHCSLSSSRHEIPSSVAALTQEQ